MKVRVNGADEELEPAMTLYDLLSRYMPPPETTYVLQNGSFVSRRDYAAVRLREGDSLTVYRIPSGG